VHIYSKREILLRGENPVSGEGNPTRKKPPRKFEMEKNGDAKGGGGLLLRLEFSYSRLIKSHKNSKPLGKTRPLGNCRGAGA